MYISCVSHIDHHASCGDRATLLPRWKSVAALLVLLLPLPRVSDTNCTILSVYSQWSHLTGLATLGSSGTATRSGSATQQKVQSKKRHQATCQAHGTRSCTTTPGIDDCVRARSCREPVRKRHVEYDIYQHIPAAHEQRTTYTDTLLHDRRA